ncbi:MAG: hypothetical protein V3R29_04240 [Candidatus Acidoferrales bacterium]
MARALVGLILVAGLACSPKSAQAQIVAPGGRTIFNRAVMIRSFVRLDNFAEGVPGVRVRRWVNPYAVVWSPYPHLNLTFVSPLVSVQRETPVDDFTTTSFSDGFVFARYDLVRHIARRGYTRLSPLVGAKLPTGGAFGNGSVDPIGGLVLSHVRDPHWLVTDFQFTYTTEGENGLRFGNQWLYDVAYVYRLLPWGDLDIPALYVVVELNGEHERRARLNGARLANTGGNLVFLSPGIEFMPTNRLVLEFSSPIPVRRDLNGQQLRPTSSFILGVRWLF